MPTTQQSATAALLLLVFTLTTFACAHCLAGDDNCDDIEGKVVVAYREGHEGRWIIAGAALRQMGGRYFLVGQVRRECDSAVTIAIEFDQVEMMYIYADWDAMAADGNVLSPPAEAQVPVSMEIDSLQRQVEHLQSHMAEKSRRIIQVRARIQQLQASVATHDADEAPAALLRSLEIANLELQIHERELEDVLVQQQKLEQHLIDLLRQRLEHLE